MKIQIPSPSALLSNSPVLTTASPVRSAVAGTNGSLLVGAPVTPGPVIQDGAATRVKQVKSRTGCTTCKKKRLKCDETKPTCVQCQRRNLTCAGYQKDYKWKPFAETKSRPKTIGTVESSRSHPSALQRSKKLSINIVGTYGGGHGGLGTQDLRHGALDELRLSPTLSPSLRSPSVIITHDWQSQHQDQPWSSSPHLHGLPSPGGVSSRHLYRTASSTVTPSINAEAISPRFSFGEHVEPYRSNANTAESSASDTNSARSPCSRLPQVLELPIGRDINQPHVPSELQPPVSLAPFRSFTINDDMDSNRNCREDVICSDGMATTAGLSSGPIPALFSQRTTPAWQAPCTDSPSPSIASRGPLDSNVMDINVGQSIDASSPEMLMLRFDRQTCSILSVKDGPTENPWRTLIWPLARESPALYHAISSMTAFHGAYENPMLHTPGMAHMTKSIRRLAAEIENMRLDCALATSLALAFSEGWESAVSTGVQHLRAASVMVKNLMIKHRQDMQSEQLTSEDVSRVRFLFNTFVYMDVVARLTSFEEACEINYEEILTMVNDPFEDQIEIDPLMGCAMTLFPLIGRVANLIQRVYKAESNSLNMVSTAMEVKEQIEKWQAHSAVVYERPEDPNSEIQHSIQTAEAYRYATLLYLHQAIPEIPSESAQALAKKVLLKLASVPLSSGAIIVQIFPLFAASCEVTDPDDRSWVMQRWAAMTARLKIGNVKSCWGVVQEVWSRRDVFETEEANRLLRRYKSRGFLGEGLVPPVMQIPPSLKRKVRTFDYANEKGVLYHGDHHTKSAPQEGDRAVRACGYWTRAAGEEIDQRLKRQVATNSNHGGLPTSMPSSVGSRYGVTMSPTNIGRNRVSRPFGDPKAPSQLEHEYTVRGQLHWLSVMAEWRWEVFL